MAETRLPYGQGLHKLGPDFPAEAQFPFAFKGGAL